MKPHASLPLRLSTAFVFVLLLLASTSAEAEQFIGFAQPSLTGSWAVESFPVFNRTTAGDVSAAADTELSYFSNTGFTGTQRDPFQFWAGAISGYTNARVASNALTTPLVTLF